MLSSIRTDSKLKDIQDRLREAEQCLTAITNDEAFIKSSLTILKDLEPLLRELRLPAKLELKHAVSPELVREFVTTPTLFGAQQLQPWSTFLRSIGGTAFEISAFLQESVPVLVIDPSGIISASFVRRSAFHLDDVFRTSPIVTFDPSTVKTVSEFLTKMEFCIKPGDTFEVQFEEES